MKLNVILKTVLVTGVIFFGVGGYGFAGDWVTANPDIYYLDGNVGIGTATPSQIFHVHRNNWSGMRITTNQTGSLFSDGVHFGYQDNLGAFIWNREDSPIIFSTYNTERVRITNDIIQGVSLKIMNKRTNDWSYGDISTGIEFIKENTVNGYIRSVHTRPGGPHSYNDAGLVFGTAQSSNEAVDRMIITSGGYVGIGILTPYPYQLNVAGTVRANEIIVNTTGADYVFENDYALKPLEELEAFIEKERHLPDIPSASRMRTEGVGISEMQTRLLAKVEELTLYLIEQNKKMERITAENEALKKRVAALEQ